MKPPRIHIGALHRNRLPRLLSPKSSPQTLPTVSQPVEVSRRHLLGLAAVAGVGFSPAVKMVETVLASTGEAFEPIFTRNRVAFSQNGEERWVIDTKNFSGHPRLTYTQSEGLITLELRHALFPGTQLPADFSCTLTQQSFGWEMNLSFSLGGFSSTIPFEKWLAGLEPARAPVWFDDYVCDPSLGKFNMHGRAHAEFFPHWVMSFSGEAIGRLSGATTRIESDVVQVALLQPKDHSLVRKPGHARTLVAMDRRTRTWSMNVPVESSSGGRLLCPDNSFSIFHIEAWEQSDGRFSSAVMAESGADDEPLAFCCRGLDKNSEELALRLRNVRYVSLSPSRNRTGQQALVAKFDQTQSPVTVHGCSFTLGHPIGTPPFELIQYEDGTRRLQCEPGINRLAVPLPGALVQPMEVPFGARLILAQTQPRGRLQVKPKRPAIRIPNSPSSKQQHVVPNASNPGSQSISPAQKVPVDPRVVVPLTNDFRATIQIPGPLAVSVVRPEDLLVLKFEFRNLNLQIGQGQPPKLVPASGGGGRTGSPALVVNFPPQHIAEETFYEAAETKDPPTFPIDARLAGWSRLVFAIPNGMAFIPYTLDSLLNWSPLQQVVAPAAAPPPAPPKRVQFKVPIKPGPKRIPRLPMKKKQSFPFLEGPVEPRWNEVRGTIHHFRVVKTLLRGSNRPQAIVVAQKNAPTLKSQQAIQSQIPNALAVRPIIPSPPTAAELKHFTALEVPYRLFLSPSAMAGWSHTTNPVVFNGRTELWHTRLGVRRQNRSGEWGVDEDSTWYRTMRAIWSPDFNEPNQGGPQRFPCGDDRTPFRMLPEAQHRHQLVHLMANGTGEGISQGDPTNITKGWQQRVMNIDQFMLSALGAWIKSRYLFDPAPLPLTVIEWVQHSNMGRDQFVKVVEQGFLYPFGHKAVLVQISERKFERTSKGIVALLRYREFIVVREPYKEYPGPGQADLTSSDGRNFPYRSLKITNLVTPNLDPKENDSVFVKESSGGRKPKCPPKDDQPSGASLAFWPKVTTEDYQWHLIGEDWAGQTSEFSIPMIFITADVGTGLEIKSVRNHYIQKAGTRKTADLSGQKVAFAPKKPGGDTVLETASLTFDAETPCVRGSCPAHLLDSLKKAVQPLFFPFVSEAAVSIPAVKNLVGTSAPTRVVYSKMYGQMGFTGSNKGELFLDLVQPVGLKFGQTDKVGGVGAPNMDIVGISREFGPIGGSAITSKAGNALSSAEKFAQGNFDPTEFFKDASILGGIDLGLILKGLGMDKAPKLVTDRLPEEMRTTFTLNVAPTTLDVGIVSFIAELKPQTPASLLMSTTITVKLPNLKNGGAPASSEPEFNSRGELRNFKLDIGKGQLILSFRKFIFTKNHGKKLDVAVELSDGLQGRPEGVKFGGALEFLAKMQELIPADGLSDPPSLEVTGSGVAVSLSIAIPSVTVGVLTLSNMKFGAALRLPFTGDPVTLRINFCSRNDPFMGAVWIFGLTGFFAVEMNGKEGLALVEVQIEFGGMWAIDIGVASGSIKLVAGFYFKYVAENKAIELEGYIKVQGCVQVLGIVTISILVKLTLAYSSVDDVVWGEALLQLKVEILFFEVSVEWKCRKELAGSSHGASGSAWLQEEEPLVRLVSDVGRPHRTAGRQAASGRNLGNRLRNRVQPRKIREMVSEQDWNQYAGAFAADVA